MNAPEFINIPTFHEGHDVTIEWTAQSPPAGMVARYELHRAFDSEEMQKIYHGPDNTYTDHVAVGVQSITYQVRAYAVHGYTWQDIRDLGRTWQEWRDLGYPWGSDISEWNQSTFEVLPNRAPVISGQDTDLGYQYRGFSYSFTVTDPDPGSTVSMTITVDGNVVESVPNVQLGVNYTYSISDDFIFGSEDGSEHEIRITVTDNRGDTATRIYTFIAAEDLTLTAIYYVLRDDEPVARLQAATQWRDYIAVGVHRYRIRAVDRYDNFVDSNEVEITIWISGSTLAIVSRPDSYIKLDIRRGDRPQRDHEVSAGFEEVQFENRTFPVAHRTTRRTRTQTVVLSVRTKPECDALLALIYEGDAVVYRDRYDMRVIGTIPNAPFEFFRRRFSDQPINYVADFTLNIQQCDYSEVVPYE